MTHGRAQAAQKSGQSKVRARLRRQTDAARDVASIARHQLHRMAVITGGQQMTEPF